MLVREFTVEATLWEAHGTPAILPVFGTTLRECVRMETGPICCMPRRMRLSDTERTHPH